MCTKGKHDIAGKQIGYWHVTDEYIKVNGYIKWKCQCQCGTVRMVNENNLLSGKSKSCGCYSAKLSKERMKDLTGKTFGMLTVIKRAENNHQEQGCWECICECGIKCIVKSSSLTSGKRKSCGCLKKRTEEHSGLRRGGFRVINGSICH